MADDLMSLSAKQATRLSGLGRYSEYIQSPHWKELRHAALERDGYRCRGCGTAERLIVHHRCYPETLGVETANDLTVLCDGPGSCHQAIHRAVNKRRRRQAREAAREAFENLNAALDEAEGTGIDPASQSPPI